MANNGLVYIRILWNSYHKNIFLLILDGICYLYQLPSTEHQVLEIESFYRSGKNTAKTALLDFICVIDVSIAFEAIFIIQKIAVTTDDIEK